MFKMQDKSIYKVILSPVLYFRIISSPTVVILLDAQEYITHPAKYAWAWHVWNRGWPILWDIFEVIFMRYSFFLLQIAQFPLVDSISGTCAPTFWSRNFSFRGAFGVFGWVREFPIRPSANSYLKSKATLPGLFAPSLSWKRTRRYHFTVFLIQV